MIKKYVKIAFVFVITVAFLLFVAAFIYMAWEEYQSAPNRNNWTKTIVLPIQKSAIEEAVSLAKEYAPEAELIHSECHLMPNESAPDDYWSSYYFLCPAKADLPRGLFYVWFYGKSDDGVARVHFSMDNDFDQEIQFDCMSLEEGQKTEKAAKELLKSMKKDYPDLLLRCHWLKNSGTVTAEKGEADTRETLWSKEYDIKNYCFIEADR